MTLLRYLQLSHLVSTVSVMRILKIPSTYSCYKIFTYCMGTVFHSADDFWNKHTFQTRFLCHAAYFIGVQVHLTPSYAHLKPPDISDTHCIHKTRVFLLRYTSKHGWDERRKSLTRQDINDVSNDFLPK